VSHLGAVQSQDYGPAKWSIGQRSAGLTDPDLDRALADGEILRTHALRPTWHFLARDDIWWVQAATAARVQARNASRYRQLGLDERTLGKANDLIGTALVGGHQKTRREIGALLEGAGISTEGQRLAYMLMNAELDCVICSGALRGKQHTYALLTERAGRLALDDEEALARLTFTYFTGHGPATVKDLAAWASLRMADVKRGLGHASSRLQQRVIAGDTFWFVEGPPRGAARSPRVHLVHAYDEYIMGYKETRWFLDISGMARRRWAADMYPGVLLLDGQVAGTWKRTVQKDEIKIDVETFHDPEKAALEAEANRFGRFLGLPSVVEVSVRRGT
jgi:hypothetical protein